MPKDAGRGGEWTEGFWWLEKEFAEKENDFDINKISRLAKSFGVPSNPPEGGKFF